MIYSTPEFLMLAAILLPAYFFARDYRLRFALLLTSSLLFYAWAGFFDTMVFLFVVVLSWAAAALAEIFPRYKRPLVAFGIFALAAHLIFWKYMPWMVRVAQSVEPGVHGGDPLFLPLPVGISFFTLQGIAYLVDYAQGEAAYIPLGPYVLFKSFFPQLVAGPIVRVPQLLPQLLKLPTPTLDDLYEGTRLFCLGFFKKLALADRISPFVDDVFLRAGSFDRASLIGAILGYSVQIWADFSGYSDMGIGVARMLGIRLPTNFMSPYFARSPSEFWKRWHITLSQWIRDYIYIPFGGSRGSPARVFGVAVLTMAISGLWHGANWTFVVWGLYHGMLLALERVFGWGQRKGSSLRAIFQWAILMSAVLLGWLLFRANSFAVAGQFLHGIVTGSGTESAGLRGPLLFALVATFGIQLWEYAELGKGRLVVQEWIAKTLTRIAGKRPLRSWALALEVGRGVALAALALLALFLRSDSPVQAFIYFQF